MFKCSCPKLFTVHWAGYHLSPLSQCGWLRWFSSYWTELPAESTILEQFKNCGSVSCLINMEPLKLLRLQPSEPTACESVEKGFFWFTCSKISEYYMTTVKDFEMEFLEGHKIYYSFLIHFTLTSLFFWTTLSHFFQIRKEYHEWQKMVEGRLKKTQSKRNKGRHQSMTGEGVHRYCPVKMVFHQWDQTEIQL